MPTLAGAAIGAVPPLSSIVTVACQPFLVCFMHVVEVEPLLPCGVDPALRRNSDN
jgi:hypothetical protein